MSKNTAELALLIDRFMRRIHFGLQAKADSFDTAKVGPGGGVILLTIAELGRPKLHELTNRVSRDKSQMTRVVRSLEAKGLVKRETSIEDARVTIVSLTDAGSTVVQGLQLAVADTIKDILGPVSQVEVDTLKSLLKRSLSDEDFADAHYDGRKLDTLNDQ